MKMNRKIVVVALLPLMACCERMDSVCRDPAAPDGGPVANSRRAGGSDCRARDFFKANGITEVRYVKAAMHIADPKPQAIMTLTNLSASQADWLAKADCGSWKREYVDDRVMDGMRWIVEFVAGEKVVKRVAGFNAEPEGLQYLLMAAGVRSPRVSDF